jgi:hypothetical protein
MFSLFRLKKLYAKYNDPKQCMEYSYEESVKEMQNVAWDSDVVMGGSKYLTGQTTVWGFVN